MVSLGEEEIADRQFLSIFGCIHQHCACWHQSERPKIVGFGPSTHDCPVSEYQRQRQIDRRRSQEHSSKLPRADNAEESLLAATSSTTLEMVHKRIISRAFNTSGIHGPFASVTLSSLLSTSHACGSVTNGLSRGPQIPLLLQTCNRAARGKARVFLCAKSAIQPPTSDADLAP